MIKINCYNCNSSNSEFYFRENGFEMVKCLDCGTLFIQERPTNEEIEIATKKGKHLGEKNLHVDVYYNKSVKPRYRKILSEIYKDGFDKIDTWLDVGCGHGEFIETLQEASNNKVKVCGLEPNITKQESAQQRRLNVTYFDLNTHDKKYNVVSLLNVFSHLVNPKEMLISISKVIEPDGHLLIQTGDAADLSAKDQLKPICLPDHLTLTSEIILCNMLEDIGYTIKSIHKYPSLAASPQQIIKEIVKLFLPNKISFLKYYLNWDKYKEQSMYIQATWKKD